MKILEYLFFNQLLVWLPLIFSFLILIIIVIKCFFDNFRPFAALKWLTFKRLILILIGGNIFFNLVLSISQYYAWLNSSLGRFLLPPHTSFFYFFRYIFFHYWTADIICLLLGILIYLILRFFKKFKDKAISFEELSLVFLICLLSGWPKMLIFIPLFFLLTLVYSLISITIFKTNRIITKKVLALTAVIVFFLGFYLIKFFNLTLFII